ncbi:colicin E3/pyocin S6 family cytotoxin, partial [Faecalicatena contorta]|uniref:colicin E3/pyocin S6 family cytotoxin n=1 Tax=Faecalicatena contorta TaxID=39482 RepID=UPI001F18391B
LVNDIEEELESNIANWIISKEEIDVEKILSPILSNPLPNSELCGGYKKVQDKLVKGECNRIPIFLKVATEVASRNGYIEDKEIEKLNRGAIRKIFRSQRGETIFLSVDVEHGALEVYNSKGKHQGEYGYTGSKEKDRDITGNHDIKVKK